MPDHPVLLAAAPAHLAVTEPDPLQRCDAGVVVPVREDALQGGAVARLTAEGGRCGRPASDVDLDLDQPQQAISVDPIRPVLRRRAPTQLPLDPGDEFSGVPGACAAARWPGTGAHAEPGWSLCAVRSALVEAGRLRPGTANRIEALPGNRDVRPRPAVRPLGGPRDDMGRRAHPLRRPAPTGRQAGWMDGWMDGWCGDRDRQAAHGEEHPCAPRTSASNTPRRCDLNHSQVVLAWVVLGCHYFGTSAVSKSSHKALQGSGLSLLAAWYESSTSS